MKIIFATFVIYLDMRKKITIGFLCLALLLLFAGAVSVYELSRLRIKTHNIIEAGMQDIETGVQTLADLQAQNDAVIDQTITYSIITSAVAIFLVLLFLFFMNIGYAKPLRKLNKGLKGYLEAKIPFDDSFESSDDITSLKEMVSGLIEQSRKNKA